MNEFLTWEMLGTFVGAVTATTLLTQVIKHFITKLDPKWIALGVATLAVMGYTLLYVQDYSGQGIAMAVVNVFMVTGASIGLFEGVKSFADTVSIIKQ